METLPVGYRFNPTEHELVGYYLKNKVMNQPLTRWESEIIVEKDLYGGEGATPWKLLEDDNSNLPWQRVVESSGKVVQSQKFIYVFTKLHPHGKNGTKQKNRVAGCGSWHGNTGTEYVKDNYGEGKIIGRRRIFTFSSREETVGQWTMYEYSIDAPANELSPDVNCENYVLCKIKKDESKSSKAGRITSRRRDNLTPNDVEWAEVDERSSDKKRKLDVCETSGLTMNKGASTSCQQTAMTSKETSRNDANESATAEEANVARRTSDDFGLGQDGAFSDSMYAHSSDDFRFGQDGAVPDSMDAHSSDVFWDAHSSDDFRFGQDGAVPDSMDDYSTDDLWAWTRGSRP